MLNLEFRIGPDYAVLEYLLLYLSTSFSPYKYFWTAYDELT